MTTRLNTIDQVKAVGQKIGDAVLQLIASVPGTTELESATPAARAQAIRRVASRKALAAAGALALPPGPWGWLTILPELRAVWRLQAQMVADIAAVYGKSATLTREQVVYCLFRHTAAQALREIMAQVGERFLVQKASVRALQAIARQIGIKVSQRSLSRVVTRWIPVVGAAGVGVYAYYDTSKIARTAIELFSADIELIDATVEPQPPRNAAPRKLASSVKKATAKKTSPEKTTTAKKAAPAQPATPAAKSRKRRASEAAPQ